jgi:hypothetical protein
MRARGLCPLCTSDLPRNFHPAAIRVSGFVRLAARMEQRAIGGAGRRCAADRPLRRMRRRKPQVSGIAARSVGARHCSRRPMRRPWSVRRRDRRTVSHPRTRLFTGDISFTPRGAPSARPRSKIVLAGHYRRLAPALNRQPGKQSSIETSCAQTQRNLGGSTSTPPKRSATSTT